MSIIPNPPLRAFPRHLYAWMGMDEHGSGKVGIKQGQAPAGFIPMVAIDQQKVQKFKPQFQAQALRYGQRIYLVRYVVEEIIDVTEEGAGL